MLMRMLFVLMLCVFCADVLAADLEREARIADQIEEAILVGEPFRLQAGGVEFLAIHTEAESTIVTGGVILLHGRGAHPDWVDVIQPLRSELPESGWETLSLQMPVAAADASDEAYLMLIPEAYPRIAAGIEFFRERQISNLVLIGHSLGARMGVEYLAAGSPEAIKATVAVGIPVPKRASEPGVLEAIAKLRLPVLDIYGSRDLQAVTKTAARRAAAARKGKNEDYRQLEVPGADHFFLGLEEDLVARVHAWMSKTTTPVESGTRE